jgi:hypothetical protein
VIPQLCERMFAMSRSEQSWKTGAYQTTERESHA